MVSIQELMQGATGADAKLMRGFASRAAGFRPSPVRDVFEVSMRPGIISLAGGNPDLELLPLEELGQMASKIIAEEGLEVLQYGSGAGLEELAELVCDFMESEGSRPRPEEVQLTAGSQMGLDLVTKLFTDPGDVILTEGPTYTGALGVFEGYEVEVQQVQMDDAGLDPAAVESRIRELEAEGKRVKFLYTIPNYQNPTGVTLADDRRAELVRVCREHDVVVVEDNPYGQLGFDGQHHRSLHSYDPDSVIYLGSFSKIFSPGVRVGWMIAPPRVRKFLQIAAEAVTICPSVLSQRLVLGFMREGMWESHTQRTAQLYRRRCEAVLAACERHMPAGTHWTVPEGGFFTWLTLPEGGRHPDAAEALPAAIDAGVVFVPGTAFYDDAAAHAAGRAPEVPTGAVNLRLAYSNGEPETLAEGVRRLASVL
ncbi:PLP-dependent aminotransferase family protein [Rothia sp. AR01]|uniref:PLP-dependent aminotransferase family protein n=1 Tax=Rothia santali TaxID=2949643 RepID=A0A9X2HBI8_9MICC|nr:PLP-dependent aminotransferase family protein [Rothia santali]MCP3426599.1 PLP-dependent aminotransferase family protein [Rothia santali]